MLRSILVAASLLLAAPLFAAEVGPAQTWTGSDPSGSCRGDRVVVTTAGKTFACSGGTWSEVTPAGVSSATAPVTYDSGSRVVGFSPSQLDASSSTAKGNATGGIYRSFADRLGDVANVKDYGASGSAQTTTGTISAGSTSLAVASAIDFAVGQGISVYQAGAASALLVAKITAISGTTITLDTAAGTSKTSVAVAHDDTAALQAAINATPAPGGITVVPSGYYNVSGATGLTLRSGTWFIGSGAGIGPDDPTNNVTTLDATRMTGGSLITGNGKGIRVEGFYLRGTAGTYQGVNAIVMGGLYLTVRDIYIYGFYLGLQFSNGSSRSQVQMVRTNIQWSWGLRINNSGSIGVSDCFFLNGNAANGVDAGGTIYITGSNDISLRLQDIDESGHGGSGVKVVNSSRILIDGPLIYSTTANGTSGWGINVDSASSEVTISNVHMKMFGGPTYGSYYQISLAGTNHRLQNVTTEPGAGGDINDTSTGTTWWNVNGIYKLPNLRTTAPAAGSKEMWADPADSYRVKLAN